MRLIADDIPHFIVDFVYFVYVLITIAIDIISNYMHASR